MILPSSTAATMVEKLSSKSTIEDASLVTSVPVMPIEMPISASFIAGASLTPSPVMATVWPEAFNAFTILSLCFGDTLAYTAMRPDAFSSCLSLSLSSSLPASIWLSEVKIPNSFPIAAAVIL
ncbi:hypothetical protein SDC9_192232 [bioreactor metagenome]|uniref:Uncharacterized protein n=1 Tax=bioreactor metagenome TaxID=1076179 RepID=A0A645I075_9ZZZZ